MKCDKQGCGNPVTLRVVYRDEEKNLIDTFYVCEQHHHEYVKHCACCGGETDEGPLK